MAAATTAIGSSDATKVDANATFFSTIARSYADVTITAEGVDTVQFLEASEGVIQLLEILGPTAFAVVIKDMQGNIRKVRERFLASPIDSATLENLVKNEKAVDPKRKATEGLMWLLRGLQFTCVALQRSQANASEELSVSFTQSYETTLKQYHNFVVKGLFAVAMKACPYRKDFYAKLGPPEQVNEAFGPWLSSLDKIIKQVQGFYTQGNWGKGL